MASQTITVIKGNENYDSPLPRGTLDKYRLVIACVKGNVSVRETMKRLLKEAIEPAGTLPILILGPTAPEDMDTGENNRIGWVTFLNGASHPSPEVEII